MNCGFHHYGMFFGFRTFFLGLLPTRTRSGSIISVARHIIWTIWTAFGWLAFKWWTLSMDRWIKGNKSGSLCASTSRWMDFPGKILNYRQGSSTRVMRLLISWSFSLFTCDYSCRGWKDRYSPVEFQGHSAFPGLIIPTNSSLFRFVLYSFFQHGIIFWTVRLAVASVSCRRYQRTGFSSAESFVFVHHAPLFLIERRFIDKLRVIIRDRMILIISETNIVRNSEHQLHSTPLCSAFWCVARITVLCWWLLFRLVFIGPSSKCFAAFRHFAEFKRLETIMFCIFIGHALRTEERVIWVREDCEENKITVMKKRRRYVLNCWGIMKGQRPRKIQWVQERVWIAAIDQDSCRLE